MALFRAAVVIIFGLLPAGIFFFWSMHGCRFWLIDPPTSLHIGDGMRPLWNLCIFCLFGMMHTALAELGVNRLLYIIIAGITSSSVIWLWQPLDGVLWQVGDDHVAWWFGTVQFVLWLIMHSWTISQMGIPEFFGFREPRKELVTGGPYAFCRHPMHLNILVSLLVTPAMTADRFTMLLAVSLYLAVAIPAEESRLAEMFGLDWRRYKNKTAMLLPGVF